MLNSPLRWTRKEMEEAFDAYSRIRKRVLEDTSEDSLDVKESRALAAEFPNLVKYCREVENFYKNK